MRKKVGHRESDEEWDTRAKNQVRQAESTKGLDRGFLVEAERGEIVLPFPCSAIRGAARVKDSGRLFRGYRCDREILESGYRESGDLKPVADRAGRDALCLAVVFVDLVVRILKME
jgi:hypothetical protein